MILLSNPVTTTGRCALRPSYPRRATSLALITGTKPPLNNAESPALATSANSVAGGARAQRRHGYPGPFQLEGDRLAETQDIGLAGAIEPPFAGPAETPRWTPTSMIRPLRRLTIAGTKSRVSSVSATTLTSSISLIRSGLIRSKRPLAPRPAALIRTSTMSPFASISCTSAAAAPTLAEIGGNDGARAAAGFQFVGQRPHRFDAAGAKDQVVAVLGKLPRQACADAAGCAGNEGYGASVVSHDDGSCRPGPLVDRPILQFAAIAIRI